MELAAKQDYPPFFEAESHVREAMGYPPYARLAGVLVHSEDRQAAFDHSGALGVKASSAREAVPTGVAWTRRASSSWAST